MSMKSLTSVLFALDVCTMGCISTYLGNMEGGDSNLTKLRKPDEDGGSMKDNLVTELLIIGLIVVLFLLIGVVLIGRMYAAAVAIQMHLHVEQPFARSIKSILTTISNALSYRVS